MIIENALGRRIGENAAVPIEFAVDAHGREGRRQSARGHDVVRRQLHLLGIEIMHHARAHMRCPHSKPWSALIDEGEIDELIERLAQRLGRVVAGMVGPEIHMSAEESAGVRLKESGDAAGQRHP